MEELQKQLNRLTLILDIVIKRHNQLCDSTGESTFAIDIAKEIESLSIQKDINQATQTVNTIRDSAIPPQ